ncbi:MAG: DNA/RNA nuclease SfsA [Candidatus Bipolaricaulaceae bacterium]
MTTPAGQLEGRLWGAFLGRASRFSIWAWVDGREELAHLPNPGRLPQILTPGRQLLLRAAAGAGRKTRFTAVGACLAGTLVSLDSTLPNRFFPHALGRGLIPRLAGWQIERREPRLGRGRADFLLRRGGERMLVEVKSVTWVENGVALFPDAPTARGRRHMRELAHAARRGEPAAVVFVIQRPDAVAFSPGPVDHRFALAFRQALAAGMQACALSCAFDGVQLELVRALDDTAIRLQ